MAIEAPPKAQVFSLKTPLLSEGRSNLQVAATDLLKLRVKVYAEGGENGLHTHRTVYVMALTDGRDIKRNEHLPVADRYGYLLTGYCTLRKQIRSFARLR